MDGKTVPFRTTRDKEACPDRAATHNNDILDALPQCWIDNKRVPIEDIANNDGLSVEDFVDYFFGKCGCKSNIFEGVVIHFTDFRY